VLLTKAPQALILRWRGLPLTRTPQHRAELDTPPAAPTRTTASPTLETAGGVTAPVEIDWTFPVAPVKRDVNYTAVVDGGHVAIDTLSGGVELNAPHQETAHLTVDVDSHASTRSSSRPSPRTTPPLSLPWPP
jgi:hypothetical protein